MARPTLLKVDPLLGSTMLFHNLELSSRSRNSVGTGAPRNIKFMQPPYFSWPLFTGGEYDPFNTSGYATEYANFFRQFCTFAQAFFPNMNKIFYKNVDKKFNTLSLINNELSCSEIFYKNVCRNRVHWVPLATRKRLQGQFSCEGISYW